MKIIEEFKTFAMRGNVLDMAVGIIIGAAFGKIITSFVNDVLMPPIGILLGNADFTYLSIILKPAIDKIPAVAINYGKFIQTIIDFIIIAFSVFMLIKGVNTFKKKQEEAPAVPPDPSAEEKLLTEIRDILKSK
jgi:large conductance mechanosensitive channel